MTPKMCCKKTMRHRICRSAMRHYNSDAMSSGNTKNMVADTKAFRRRMTRLLRTRRSLQMKEGENT
jgi:hypothetical protein